jgi:hypothetical protein
LSAITCHCSAIVDLNFPELIDIDVEPDYFRQLLEGSFLTVTCPNCGTVLKPELQVRLCSTRRGLDCLVVPELERLSVYRGKITAPPGVEILVGYSELFERARILRDGFEIKNIEIIKYYLLSKAEEQEPEADITVLYNGQAGGKLEFHILGMKSGQTGIIRLPRSSIDASASDSTIEDPRFGELFLGQYRSIRKLSFLEEEEENEG